MMVGRTISEALARALSDLVRASEAARASSGDRQAARRAIEQAAVVARLAGQEGFGEARPGPDHGP